MNNELEHHGILGMKWGVRRYQNSDGTSTEEGKSHRKETAKRIAIAAAVNAGLFAASSAVSIFLLPKLTNKIYRLQLKSDALHAAESFVDDWGPEIVRKVVN